MLLLALSLGVPAVLSSPATTADNEDAGGIASISHADSSEVVTYTVTLSEDVQPASVARMRFDLDFDGDERVGGRDDACIVLEPVKGRRIMRAEVFEGCAGDPVASADARPKRNIIKLKLLIDELHDAGLSDEATGYGYRFTATTRNATTDEVPDEPGTLITHTFGQGQKVAQQTPAASPVLAQEKDATVADDSGASAAAKKKRPGGGPDTRSDGTSDPSVVEPGKDVDIEGGGFAQQQSLSVTLISGTATSTATPSPSPTPTPTTTTTPTPTPTSAATPATGRSLRAADVRSARADAAAAAKGERLGTTISDAEGNFEEDVEIPDDTKNGKYTIEVVGANRKRGTHTVTIPITVAAEVDNESPSGQVGNNATTTATQASPPAAGGAVTGAILPKTGSSALLSITGVGFLSLLTGAMLLWARWIARKPQLPGRGSE